ncbi:hypothetical protein MMC08_001649 [Hypocenomyce scalaris]|nr:hypothetical protein [Hypocenomyce scalaris]
MSLAISLWWFLPFFFPSFVLAGPQNTIYTLPTPVPIPDCAQGCLAAFIAQAFPTSICSDQQDFDCLCTHNSTTGYTLGEGALQCVAAACPEELYEYAAVYELCAQVEDAQPETHGTLTATMQATVDSQTLMVSPDDPTSSSSLPASILDPASTISTTDTNIITAAPSRPTSLHLTSPSILLAPSTSISATPTSTSQPFQSNPTTIATSSATAAAAADSNKPVLTRPQVAGVAVAGVASAALGFGLMICILCLRRRRAARRRHSGSSFGGDRVVSTQLNPPDKAVTTAPDSRPGSHWLDPPVAEEQRQMLSVPPRVGELRWSNMWRRSVKPEEIGVAVAPGMVGGSPGHDATYDNSPVSAASYRTTSRLLPDKPSYSSSSYSLFPSPLKINHDNRPESGATVFEEDAINGPRTSIPPPRQARRGRGSVDTSKIPLQRNLYPSASDPFLSSSTVPRALMYAKEQRRRSRNQLPPLDPQPPSRQHNGQWTTSPDQIRPPPPTMTSINAPANLSCKSLPLLRKPIPPPTRPPLAAIISSNSNSNSNPSSSSSTSLPRKGPPPKRKSLGKRPPTYFSTTSETSFESGFDVDEMEDLPYPSSGLFPASSSNPEPSLSPVAETEEGSARRVVYRVNGNWEGRAEPQRSPLSDIKYPRIPGSVTSPHRIATPVDSPTRKPPPRRRERVMELEGSPVYPTRTSSFGQSNGSTIQTSKSLPMLPTSPRAGQFGGGGNGQGNGEARVRQTAKYTILQNPGLSGLGGLHPSPARSQEEEWVRR